MERRTNMPVASLATAPTRQSTPAKRTPVLSESPGNWKHPRLAEITQRQSRTVFSDKNVKTILYNLAALALLLVLRTILDSKVIAGLLTATLKLYVSWGYRAFQAIPFINIVRALLPLIRRRDDLSDIPLNAAQRKLLGLAPSSVPATPNSVYSTPPRYSRTPSLAGSPASNKSFGSSPMSGNGSPASERRLSGSPYSPAAASPLLQKAVSGGIGGARKASFGSQSPRGTTTTTNLFGDSQGTPSPSAGKRSSVQLNSKWLYERGRRTSSNAFLL